MGNPLRIKNRCAGQKYAPAGQKAVKKISERIDDSYRIL